jgi:SSS family transporter
MTLDLIIIAAYFVIINIIGIRSSRAGSIRDYFLADNRISWPMACFSIVATETSSLTFISIPGLAYTTGVGFMQIAMGYLIGRVLVALFLIPEYYRGKLHTVYEYLQIRFGYSPRLAVSVLFHVTRILADGIRLFATAIPLAMLMGWGDYRMAILIMGVTTLLYTLYGGIRSVVVIDTIQLFIYLAGAFIGLFTVVHLTGSSFADLFMSIPAEKLNIFSTGFSGGSFHIFTGYNIVSGLRGGAMLSLASHGTDHLMVQRGLACSSESSAKKAMVWSGIVVLSQFALFLVLGLFIMIFMQSRHFDRPDEIMPYFIINHIPAGLRGIMLAGIFAAAMSSLASTVNSLSASTVMDILRLHEKSGSPEKQVRMSRLISLFWTAVLVIIAMSLSDTKSPLVELGLGISSLIYGGVLAMFFQARFFRNFSDRAAIAGMFCGIAFTVAISRLFVVFWPWFIPVGFIVSLSASSALNSLIMRSRSSRG